MRCSSSSTTVARAALATVLFIAVLPVMFLNLRNFRRQAVEG